MAKPDLISRGVSWIFHVHAFFTYSQSAELYISIMGVHEFGGEIWNYFFLSKGCKKNFDFGVLFPKSF